MDVSDLEDVYHDTLRDLTCEYDSFTDRQFDINCVFDVMLDSSEVNCVYTLLYEELFLELTLYNLDLVYVSNSLIFSIIDEELTLTFRFVVCDFWQFPWVQECVSVIVSKLLDSLMFNFPDVEATLDNTDLIYHVPEFIQYTGRDV